MASTPLFIAQSRVFMLEIPQVLMVNWFIYLMVTARNNGKITLLLKLITASSLAMLTKVSMPLFCIAPGIVITSYLFAKHDPPSSTQSKSVHSGLAIVTVISAAYAFAWYIHNARLIQSHTLHNVYGGFTTAALYRLSYWIVAIQDNFFLWPVIVLIVALFGYCTSAFCRKKPNNLSEMARVTVYISVIQILLYIISFSITTNGAQRYTLPILPYLVLLICYCVMRIGRRIVTTLVIAVFLFQFIFVHLLSFHIIFHAEKWAGAVQQSASFMITNTLIPIHRHRYDEEIKIMDKIATLAKTSTLEGWWIITDKMGKIGTSAPLTYYASCKAFPKAPVCRLYSFGINRTPFLKKAGTKEEKWAIFLAKRPGRYYITLKTAEFARMANDNRILELSAKKRAI